ncbi:hypothetical protein [Paenibacillus sp. 1P07SE]|uniref:hypothetical protein n=1 Tax=Paenibacillus sp. 1P07SE TaxID=3132209 RepID=UPI0039A69B23
MLQPHALSLLGDKIHTVGSDTTSLMLVGPINLPVNLEGNTVVFQWYCWLPVKDQLAIDEYRSANVEFFVRRLSILNLAESQQSSVLVYGDFAQDAHAIPVRLITNNPKKLEALRSAGLNVLGRVPLWGDQSEYNARYLKTKVERSGHFGDHEIRYPEQDAKFLQVH